MAATKNIYQDENSSEEQPEKSKPKITSSGRPSKKPQDLAIYTEKIGDELDDVEEENGEVESDFEEDEEYHVESEAEYDSDCFDYDIVKK
jgi:hypothetical protein